MKYVDEFRDSQKAGYLFKEIETLAAQITPPEGRPLHIMEVCGGHTHSIFRYGIEGMLPKSIELVHGPGCPVCVLPMGRVDDALAIARKNPDREIVFFGLGFETTMPSTALTVLAAESEGIRNFSVFCNHITIVPTLRAILDSPELELDGFIGPGHVSMVIGITPYEIIARGYRKPMVISGFEPLDILQSLWMVLKQIKDGRAEIENQYARIVPDGGNAAALDAVGRVYELRDFFEWRGLGSIVHSGVKMRADYAAYDAEQKFSVPNAKVADPEACQCGEVLKGVIKPWQCRVFGTGCTPETPLGALMVSPEGACSAYYQYGGIKSQAGVA